MNYSDGGGISAVLRTRAQRPALTVSDSPEFLALALAPSIALEKKSEQKQNEVAAAVSVITRDEIKAFGWRSLAEALASLPGVHTAYERQYTYLGLRGFGLPWST